MWQPNKLEQERLEKVEKLRRAKYRICIPRVYKRTHTIAGCNCRLST